MDFYDLPLDDNILDALDSMNFETCTPIQEKTIIPLLKGRDLIGVAQTGTGKTAAYLLPILNRLNTGEYSDNAINCIIMSPTRELAQQIDQQVEGLRILCQYPVLPYMEETMV
jgi:superfamily II DNA/RNA helicase